VIPFALAMDTTTKFTLGIVQICLWLLILFLYNIVLSLSNQLGDHFQWVMNMRLKLIKFDEEEVRIATYRMPQRTTYVIDRLGEP
jgi:hypothetical protein